MGFSLVATGLLRDHLPDTNWQPLVVNLGYSVGFLIAILGRQQRRCGRGRGRHSHAARNFRGMADCNDGLDDARGGFIAGHDRHHNDLPGRARRIAARGRGIGRGCVSGGNRQADME